MCNEHFPQPLPDKMEELLQDLRTQRVVEQATKEAIFRMKVEAHKKAHPCCIYPEVCVTLEEAPKPPWSP